MPQPVLEAATLDDLRARLAGQLVTPDDDAYEEARRVWNGMIDRRPAAIAHCESTDDVVAAVACAREHGLEVAVRCGAHSTPGYSTTEGGLVIDVGPMKSVEIDPEARTARIGGGLKWGELDAATQEHGLAVTGGRVTDTGVTGLALGSGSGWLERIYGITCESLIGAEVVLADGSVVRAGEDGDADLLWALRGGGGNFGVVTELTFKVHPVGPVLLAGMLLYPREIGREVARFYRDYMESAPDELCGGLAFIHAPPAPFVPEDMQLKPATGIVWAFVGAIEEGERALAPLREAFEARVDMVQPMPYTALQSLLDEGNPWGIHEYFRIDWLSGLSDEAIDTVLEQAELVPSPMTQIILAPMGGAVDRIDRSSMALEVPAARWAYFCLGLWPKELPDEPNVAWTRGFAAAMKPYVTGAAFPNFIAEDESEERLVSAYGPDKYARLRELKRRYDPDNLFRLNQNIRPA
jgi:FAD/FMN-containing dehydrogenase